jgi:hypothetical protein
MTNQEVRDHLAELDRGISLGRDVQLRLCKDLLKANKRLIEIRKQGGVPVALLEAKGVANLAEKRAARGL